MALGDTSPAGTTPVTTLRRSSTASSHNARMIMKPGLRKLVLSVHLTCSIGWIGTVVAYLALGITAANDSEEATIRGAWMAMELIGWYVIVPLAVASFLTGLVMALGTKWGLFRHYWVSISFFLTLFATVVLILHMPTVSSTADVARTADVKVLESLGGDLHHPAIGLVILLVVQVLNLYKPQGLTRYGLRKQQEQRAVSQP